MKWWNKNRGRNLRRGGWTEVRIEGWNTDEFKRWCQQSSSKGRFYGNARAWYFEYPEDATLFLLKWGGDVNS